MFMSFLLARNTRVEEDLIEINFNSSERRLARLLLLLADYGKEGGPKPIDSKNYSGNIGRNDRHDTIARQLLHE